MVRLVQGLATRQPLVLILEDLHWADEMSQRLLAFLSRRVSSSPVLLVGTAREEELADAPFLRSLLTELDRGQDVVKLTLAPLSRPDTVALVRELARAGTDESAVARLGERMWAVSEGNPFMVVETLRALQEGEIPQAPSALPLPQRVREVIAGRLERLSDRNQQLVAAAAVIGCEFEFALLQRASGLGEREAAEGVEEMVRRRVFHGVGESFDFTHDRIREVAFRSLLAPRRRALHAAVGQGLEALYADRLEEAYDRLAYHYSKAEQTDKAVTFLTRFAEKAARGHAHAEAVAALQEALGHAERLPAEERDRRLPDLILRQARGVFSLGRFADALDLLLGQQERVERLQNPQLAGRYYFLLGNTYSYLGDHERAAQSVRRALEEATRCGDEAAMGKAHYLLALEGFWSRPVQGAEHGRPAVGLLERSQERWWLGQAHWLMGLICCYLGEFEGALETLARAAAIADALEARRLQSYVAWTTGFVYTLTGDGEAGIGACKDGVERSPDPVSTATALGLLSLAYLETGDPDGAIPLLEQAVPQTRRFRLQPLHGLFTTFLGEARLLKGDIGKGRELAIQGLDITRSAEYWYGVGWTLRALARGARASGDVAEAGAYLKEALQTFNAIQARFEVGRTHLALAELAHAAANREAASAHLAEACGLFTALAVPKYVERTEQLAGGLGVSLLEGRVR